MTFAQEAHLPPASTALSAHPAHAHSASAAADHHAAMQARFGWQVPRVLNMAQACCVRWAMHPEHQNSIAIIADGSSGEAIFHSYFELHSQANRLANVLSGPAGLGVARGDRVAIVMPQRFETAVAYMGVLQAGAVGMPLSMLFGPEALAYRLQDSEAAVAIVDAAGLPNVLEVLPQCPALRTVLVVGTPASDVALSAHCQQFDEVLAAASDVFTCVETDADEPAVLIYTSGTTGNPKGGLIPHRALVGNLSGFVCSQNLFGFSPDSQGALPFPCGLTATAQGDHPVAEPDTQGTHLRDWPLPTGSQAVFWSPADWAWTGGLMDALLPTLFFGRPIVAYNGRFSPEAAFTLMQRHGVTHSFLFPTALKAMMKAYPEPRRQFNVTLQGLMSAGEAVGDAVFAWCREQLGVVVNEMFGQTEVNYIVGNFCLGQVWGDDATLRAGHNAAAPQPLQLGWPAKPGSMGKGYPGHRVTTLDDEGNECPVGVPGEVAVHRRNLHGQLDPIFMLGYWRKPEATLAKFTGAADDSWFRTGDMAVRDADGYLWYHGRADDVFKSAGYRIGPSEIENCLVKHPAVLNAAVVPKPDAERGALVKAYVVLSAEFIANNEYGISGNSLFDSGKMAPLVTALQAHVKERLAPYEYPKEIEFVDTLPMTTTGKVQRRILRLQEEERAKGAR